MVELKLQAFGDSTGIAIPEQMPRRMGARAGDRVYLVETPEGYLLTPFDEEARRQIKLGLALMERYRETYRRLADS